MSKSIRHGHFSLYTTLPHRACRGSSMSSSPGRPPQRQSPGLSHTQQRPSWRRPVYPHSSSCRTIHPIDLRSIYPFSNRSLAATYPSPPDHCLDVPIKALHPPPERPRASRLITAVPIWQESRLSTYLSTESRRCHQSCETAATEAGANAGRRCSCDGCEPTWHEIEVGDADVVVGEDV